MKSPEVTEVFWIYLNSLFFEGWQKIQKSIFNNNKFLGPPSEESTQIILKIYFILISVQNLSMKTIESTHILFENCAHNI